MPDFSPSNVVNDRDRPRVLLLSSKVEEETTFRWLAARCGTYKRIDSIGDVDPSEWDVLVCDTVYSGLHTTGWGTANVHAWTRVPNHLHIFNVFDSKTTAGTEFFEFNVDADGAADLRRALLRVTSVAGHQVRRVDSLPEAIQDLVKSSLVPVVERRDRQFGIRTVGEQLAPAVLRLRPFLFGPSGILIAGSYERTGGASIWLVPSDIVELDQWFDAALVEWHLKDRRTFPNVSTWQSNPDWDTRDESVARASLDKLNADHATAVATYEALRGEAEAELTAAHAAASSGPKALLSAQDDLLQLAAKVALEDLGFDVEDMDLVWNERERREDFRITDPDDPGWLAIADVTGVAKGAPGSKITTVLGYIMKYVLEKKATDAPSLWVIVNQLFHRDPLTRGDIYRPDDLQTIESNNGIALDTAALYVLSQSISPGSARATACRAWLRAARGQVTVMDAKSWLRANP